MNKPLVIAGVMAGVVATAAVGGMAYGSKVAEERVGALVAASGRDADFRLSNLKHQAGLVTSTGTVEVAMVSECDEDAGGDLRATVEYTISHLPMPGAAARFQVAVKPAGGVGNPMRELLGDTAAVTGTGKVGFGGGVSADLKMPEITVRGAGESTKIAASAGTLAMSGDTLRMNWLVDDVTSRREGETVQVSKLKLDLDLTNVNLGTGTARLAVDRIDAHDATVEGLAIASETVQRGEFIDSKIIPSIRSIKAQGKQFREMSMEFGVKGLHAKSLESLGQVASASCGFTRMTVAESETVRDAVRTVLKSGLSFGMPKFAFASDDGAVQADFDLTLKPNPDAGRGAITIAQFLKSTGSMTVSGKLIDDGQKQMVVQQGFAVAKGDALTASYEYAAGKLSINGKPDQTGIVSMIDLGLASLDQALAVALASPGKTPTAAAVRAESAEPAAAPAAAPAPEAPAAMPAVAPAAGPAAAAAAALAAAPAIDAVSCATAERCTELMVKAAAREDVETVRALAARVDELPKPAPGNKAVARQLNTAGLEALKRDDFTTAIARFKEGLAENPRDVELASNLGYAFVKAGDTAGAEVALLKALALDARRTSTWTPMAEAQALAGSKETAVASLWLAHLWSGNREKTMAYYADRASLDTRPEVASAYRDASAWVSGAGRPMMFAKVSR